MEKSTKIISFAEFMQQMDERTWAQWGRSVVAPVVGLAGSLLAPGMQNQAAAQDYNIPKHSDEEVADVAAGKMDFKGIAQKTMDALASDASRLGKTGYGTGKIGDYTIHIFNLEHPTVVVKSNIPAVQQKNILSGKRRAEAKVINNSGKMPVYKIDNGKIMVFFTHN